MRAIQPISLRLRLLCLATILLPITTHAQDPRRRPAPDPRKPASQPAEPFVNAATSNAAGEYLTTVSGCNDCHTPGWAQSNGRTPPSRRFTGTNIGYRGPWGTSYPANLRLVAQQETEDEWVRILTTADHGKGKPPMPWMNTAQTSDRDLRAMYRYIRSLGARGAPAPKDVAPNQLPNTPFINFVPMPAPKSGR